MEKKMDLEVGGKLGLCYRGNQETIMFKEWGTAGLCPVLLRSQGNDRNVTIGLGALVRALSEVVDKPHWAALMFLAPSHTGQGLAEF